MGVWGGGFQKRGCRGGGGFLWSVNAAQHTQHLAITRFLVKMFGAQLVNRPIQAICFGVWGGGLSPEGGGNSEGGWWWYLASIALGGGGSKVSYLFEGMMLLDTPSTLAVTWFLVMFGQHTHTGKSSRTGVEFEGGWGR
jgi:hypothetical protein